LLVTFAFQSSAFLRAESGDRLSRRSESLASDFSIPHAAGSPVKRSASQQGFAFPEHPGPLPATPKARRQ